MNWVPKTMDDVDPVSEIDIRTVISCYKLIKACKPEFRSLISELLRAMQSGLGLLSRCSRYQERAKTVSHKDAPLFCLTHSYYRDGYLTPLRAGPRYIINSYINLRRRENPEHFFNPGHPCYYARLAFNESVRIYRKLFNTAELKQMYGAGDYEQQNEDNLKSILSFVQILDEKDGFDDFLATHKDTTFIGRGGADIFCS
uniref:Uncharacterized protein n=2 Tax=Chlamydia pneumoniae TaxID=83558 RepID=A0A0F7X147_CHLPN|nr:Uncharacterized protein BN1224_DC9_AU_00020 [Chlamydia pneumoniae]